MAWRGRVSAVGGRCLAGSRGAQGWSWLGSLWLTPKLDVQRPAKHSQRLQRRPTRYAPATSPVQSLPLDCVCAFLVGPPIIPWASARPAWAWHGRRIRRWVHSNTQTGTRQLIPCSHLTARTCLATLTSRIMAASTRRAPTACPSLTPKISDASGTRWSVSAPRPLSESPLPPPHLVCHTCH